MTRGLHASGALNLRQKPSDESGNRCGKIPQTEQDGVQRERRQTGPSVNTADSGGEALRPSLISGADTSAEQPSAYLQQRLIKTLKLVFVDLIRFAGT